MYNSFYLLIIYDFFSDDYVEPRMTRDIDLVVEILPGMIDHIEKICREIFLLVPRN